METLTLTGIFVFSSAVSFYLGMKYGNTRGIETALLHVRHQLQLVMQKISAESRADFDRASIQVTMEQLAARYETSGSSESDKTTKH